MGSMYPQLRRRQPQFRRFGLPCHLTGCDSHRQAAGHAQTDTGNGVADITDGLARAVVNRAVGDRKNPGRDQRIVFDQARSLINMTVRIVKLTNEFHGEIKPGRENQFPLPGLFGNLI